MSKPRPRIPEDLQRRVRVHCGFGCAICGEMPTSIEHIVPYSTAEEHLFENLVLLCVKHHQEVTSGRLAKQTVQAARSSPFSRKLNSAIYQPTLKNHWEVKLGASTIRAPQGSVVSPFSISGIRPLTFHLSDPFRVSMDLKDRDGGSSLKVNENTFVFQPSTLWDVRLSGRHLNVRFGEEAMMISCTIDGGTISIDSLRTIVGNVPICIEKGAFEFPGANIYAHGGNFVSLTPANFSIFSYNERGNDSFFRLPGDIELSNSAEAWASVSKRRISYRQSRGLKKTVRH